MTSYFGILLLLILITECALFLIIYFCQKQFPWIITRSSITPKFREDVIEKFIKNNFDAELGWAPKPFNTGSDKTSQGIKSYSINKDGCRSNPGFDDKSSMISVFGDSYSFGRLVNDQETWAHMLSKEMKTNIKNYSVGNYGFDQALLRAKREIDNLDSEIIIINIVPESISRIHSYWKHYFEYGNILAFKPIYKLEDQELKLHKPFIKNKSDFSKLESRQKEITELDIFYHSKFLKDVLSFPFFISIFKSRERNLSLISEIMKGLVLGDNEIAYRNAFNIVIQKNAEYSASLYSNKQAKDLFLELIKEFVILCESRNKIPMVLFCPQPIDLKRRAIGLKDYDEFIKIASKYVELLDLTTLIYNNNEYHEYFIEGELGPHLSPDGNKLVMDYLLKYLKDR